MDGISNIFGCRSTWFSICGVEYELQVSTLGCLGRRERRILGMRPDALELVHRIPIDLPAVAVEQILSDIQRERIQGAFVSAQDWIRFSESLVGVIVRFWFAAEPRHPEVNSFQAALDLVNLIIEEGRLQELRRALAEVDELDIRPAIKSGGDFDEDDEIEAEHPDGRRKRNTAWAPIFRRLIDEKHLSPSDAAGLSYVQACVVLGMFAPEDLTIKRIQA